MIIIILHKINLYYAADVVVCRQRTCYVNLVTGNKTESVKMFKSLVETIHV